MQNYHFHGEESIASPALIYYRDIIEQNIKTAIEEAGNAERLWPHIKSHKSSDMIKLQLDHGIHRFKCATIKEAAVAAETGADHIFLAYPLVGPNIEHFLRLVLSFPGRTFYALGDDLEQLALLGAAAAAHQIVVNCMVDVNTGMNRTGVPIDRVEDFYHKLQTINGIRPVGLHCYDGDRHEKDYQERESMVMETISRIDQLCLALEADGLGGPILIMGGSPSFPCYSKHMPNAYVSPGTVVLYDTGYTEQFPDLPYQAGAAVMTRVISHPGEGIFTLDAGYKAVSAEQKKCGILVGIEHAAEMFQSEEHWTFRMENGYEDKRPHIGDILYILPWHICPTSAMYEEVYVVSGESYEENWRISARGRN